MKHPTNQPLQTTSRHYRVLAFDFGASSGRAILATYRDGSLAYQEVHRFENNPKRVDDTLFWDFDSLFQHVKRGMEKAGSFDSISFDSWGVDFGLIGADGGLLQPPVHYRDSRTVGMIEEVRRVIPDEILYRSTGNQMLEFNTLFQLVALQQKNPELLAQAKQLLFIPDLFAYQLCGKRNCDVTIASTSQMLDPQTGQWATSILEKLNIHPALLPSPGKPGKVIGNYQGVKVISGAGHDTQCAIAAMPTAAQDADVAFLSCGTWSILGTELENPILTPESLACKLSHEVGANGKINYLKNISGLWLIQESRREWRRQGQEFSYAELEDQARTATPFRCFIDPDDAIFASFGDLPGSVQRFCARTGQQVPQTVGEIMRCIYESLAFKYRDTLDLIQEKSKKDIHTLHILGGGAKDSLLCQMTANSTQMNIIAGPVEATALGNIMMQLIALDRIKDVNEGRALLPHSENLIPYTPTDTIDWSAAYSRYREILG